MLDIHQLNVFLMAAEAMNFTQAAQRLHMTQPSVSQHIQALEKHFNIPLFIRAGRSLELTDAGMALIPLAQEAVHLSIRIEEIMASLKGDVYGHLLVGCSTTPGKYILPQLLAKFHHRYPRVRATCKVISQSQSIDMLCDGEVHFALASQNDESCAELEFKPYLCDSVILIAPLDHPWAEKEVIEPEDLIEAAFILREDGSGTYSAVREALSRVDISINDLDPILILGNSEAIALAVQEGLGVGFVSEIVVDRLVNGRVARIQVRGLEICRDIAIGRHVRRPSTTAQNAFWDFVNNERDLVVQKVFGYSPDQADTTQLSIESR
jgi:DNA-binding transcriptional LysR family regulator